MWLTHSRLTYSINEDFFQRGFHHFELAEPGPGGSQLQQFLEISAGREPHFDVVAVVVERLHQPGFLEEVGVAVILDLDVAISVTGLDLVQIALQNGAAMIDQADGVA